MADLVHVKGLGDLQKFLDTLPVKLEANVMRGALRAGMKVIKPVAQSNVRSVSGKLAQGLMISTRIMRRDGLIAKTGSAVASLKAKGPHGYIAMWVEYGTQAHYISVREDEKNINVRRSFGLGRLVRESMTTLNRRVLQIGQTFVGPTVFHPGAKGRGFMRKALDSQAQNAVVAAAEYMKQRLATKHGIDTSGVTIEGDEA